MKAIAVIEVLDGGKGKWYIDGQIRYTENESLIKKFDKELIPLKPLPKKEEKPIKGEDDYNDFCIGYTRGWNECLEDILGETE